MKYLKYHNNSIDGFDAAGFLKEYNHRKSAISSLEKRLCDLEESGISAISYDGERVQTSNIPNPTERLAILMLHIERQISYHRFWLDACDDAISKLEEDERWILVNWYIKGCSQMDAIEHLHIERTAMFNLKKRALEHFADFLIGYTTPPFIK